RARRGMGARERWFCNRVSVNEECVASSASLSLQGGKGLIQNLFKLRMCEKGLDETRGTLINLFLLGVRSFSQRDSPSPPPWRPGARLVFGVSSGRVVNLNLWS